AESSSPSASSRSHPASPGHRQPSPRCRRAARTARLSTAHGGLHRGRAGGQRAGSDAGTRAGSSSLIAQCSISPLLFYAERVPPWLRFYPIFLACSSRAASRRTLAPLPELPPVSLSRAVLSGSISAAGVHPPSNSSAAGANTLLFTAASPTAASSTPAPTTAPKAS